MNEPRIFSALLVLVVLVAVLDRVTHSQACTALQTTSTLGQASKAVPTRPVQVVLQGVCSLLASPRRVLESAVAKLALGLSDLKDFLIYTTQRWNLIIGYFAATV